MDGPVAPSERLWTVREVAQYLALPCGAVYKLVAAGEVPCIRVGGRLRFRKSDIDVWLESRKTLSELERRRVRQTIARALTGS